MQCIVSSHAYGLTMSFGFSGKILRSLWSPSLILFFCFVLFFKNLQFSRRHPQFQLSLFPIFKNISYFFIDLFLFVSGLEEHYFWDIRPVSTDGHKLALSNSETLHPDNQLGACLLTVLIYLVNTEYNQNSLQICSLHDTKTKRISSFWLCLSKKIW